MKPVFLRYPFLKTTTAHLSSISKSRKTASYFTLTISLLSLSFFGLFAIRPTLITGVTLVKNVSDLQKLDIQYEEKISSLVKAQLEYEKVRESIPLVFAALPADTSSHKLSQKLESFAQREMVILHQLQIGNVPISKISTEDKLQKYNFSLVASGDYLSLLSYLQDILGAKRIVTLSSLEFFPESSPSGHLRLTIKGTTYYQN